MKNKTTAPVLNVPECYTITGDVSESINVSYFDDLSNQSFIENYKDEVVATERADYQTPADRLQDRNKMRLLHAAMGLVDEANEFQVALKKHVFYGKEVDNTNLKEELGDLLWYLTIALDTLESSYEEVMQMNLEKLRKRYGVKFSEEKAVNRDIAGEREVLEQNQN
jgi:NTP pyrophosphatase (non-canonical NTP hydrolase)